MSRSVRSLISVAVLTISMASAVAHAQVAGKGAVVRDYAAEVACGARAGATPSDMSLRIAAGREHGKVLFGLNDPIIIIGQGVARAHGDAGAHAAQVGAALRQQHPGCGEFGDLRVGQDHQVGGRASEQLCLHCAYGAEGANELVSGRSAETAGQRVHHALRGTAA